MGTLQLLIFRIPGVFHVGYAPLSRYLRSRTGDSYRAENLFILLASSLVIVLMIANQLAWAFVRDEVLSDPRGATALTFWLIQLGITVLFVVTCIIGFKPTATITCTKSAINIQDGKDHITIPYQDINLVKVITASQYHGHYRRYKATSSIVNRMEEKQVLVRTEEGPYVLGLPELEIPAFVRHINEQRERVPETVVFEASLV